MKRKTDNFSKFINRKSTGAVKEEIRQEKKLIKKERKEGIERHFEEKRNKRAVAASLKADVPSNVAGKTAKDHKAAEPAPGATLPLNKYVAHAGVSSRRASAILVKEGKVTVNGVVVTDPGTKVLYTDTVKVAGKKVTVSSHFVYILLNKPKDFLTTTTDPQGRKTVQQLIAKATEERVYPIGRLDRNTSGVLLFTNDGDLAQKLSHPKNEMKKIYHVGLDKPLTKQHFEKIMGGVELEDGISKVDEMAYADPKDKTQIGLEIHSGKNRIVRRIFAALGYDVKTLDRVMYAGLTKKNVQRGNWRFLTEKEIRELKYLKS
jgi:23S rRNA pseudouridine2605 synthase